MFDSDAMAIFIDSIDSENGSVSAEVEVPRNGAAKIEHWVIATVGINSNKHNSLPFDCCTGMMSIIENCYGIAN